MICSNTSELSIGLHVGHCCPPKLMKSHWCVPFTATFSKRRKIGALWSERCDTRNCCIWSIKQWYIAECAPAWIGVAFNYPGLGAFIMTHMTTCVWSYKSRSMIDTFRLLSESWAHNYIMRITLALLLLVALCGNISLWSMEHPLSNYALDHQFLSPTPFDIKTLAYHLDSQDPLLA